MFLTCAPGARAQLISSSINRIRRYIAYLLYCLIVRNEFDTLKHSPEIAQEQTGYKCRSLENFEHRALFSLHIQIICIGEHDKIAQQIREALGRPKSPSTELATSS